MSEDRSMSTATRVLHHLLRQESEGGRIPDAATRYVDEDLIDSLLRIGFKHQFQTDRSTAQKDLRAAVVRHIRESN